jgi:hypothetical protein
MTEILSVDSGRITSSTKAPTLVIKRHGAG